MAQQGIIIPLTSTPQFPGCALSCTTLLQAQDVCMPPNQPQSAQLVYDQCFCNSPSLALFATTPDGICVSECQIETDRQLLQAWYNGFCAQVRQGIDPTTLTATGATTVATATVTATQGTAIVTRSSTATPLAAGPRHETWIEGHWQWILMLVILAVGLGLLAWFAVWFKRRQRRKRRSQQVQVAAPNNDPEKRSVDNLVSTATPDLWGPHQMMHATQGFGYANIAEEDTIFRDRGSYRGADTSGRPEKNIIGLAEVSKASRPASQRARPSDLEMNARMIGAADRRSKSRTKSRNDDASPVDKEIAVAMPEIDSTRVRSKARETDPEKT